MKKLFSTMLIAFVCAGALLSQDRVQKVVTIKNGNLNGILRTVKDLAPGNNLLISTDNEHIILSGSKEVVTGFEEVIKQLDVTPAVKRDIESNIYMIVASGDGPGAGSIPSELEPVIKQLKGIFSYKNFRVLESFVLRSRDGESGETSGMVLTDETPGIHRIRYEFRYRRVSLDGTDTAKSIRFDHLQLSLKVPTGTNQITFENAGISTDVDVPEGKKVVVGKTSGILGSDSALILVISAKVVD